VNLWTPAARTAHALRKAAEAVARLQPSADQQSADDFKVGIWIGL